MHTYTTLPTTYLLIEATLYTNKIVLADTQIQAWGDRFLPNYTTQGNLRIDHIFEYLLSDRSPTKQQL